MAQTKYCLRHPNTETNLGCSRCGNPICPQCLVQTPVGARCRDCAQIRRLPTFDVTPMVLARAIGVGLVLAIAGAALFYFLDFVIFGIPFGGSLAGLAMGFVIGEAISRAVNRRRGRTLKWVAGASVALMYVGVFSLVFFNPFMLITAAIAVYIAVNRF